MMTTIMRMFDEIWYVYTSVENRIKRLMASRGYSEEKCRGIMANQASGGRFTGVLRRVCWTTTAGLRIFGWQIASFLGKED
ncbi:MAG: dephospho-CoA kinase [Clostridium fessum]